MDNRDTTAPPHPSVYYPATNMGPPPSVSPIRRVAHSSQPSPVLDTHYPPSNWGMVTPPNANAQSSSAFISPTKGAAHRLQPPTEDPTSIYRPVVRGQSNAPSPHNSAHPYSTTRMGPPTDWGTVYPSHPLPEHSMAIDQPSAVNDRGYYRGYYSRVPTPHSQCTTVTPPRVHPRHSPHPSPQAYAETQPRQISNLPPPRNAFSAVGYLGDIPANQPPHQHGIASPTRNKRQRESNRVDVVPVRGPTKRGYNDIEDEEGHGNEHEEMDDIVSLNIRFMPRLTHSLTSAELSSILDKEENQSHQCGLRT